MKRHFQAVSWSLLTLAALSSNAVAETFVPISKVVEATATAPFECGEYDRKSGSCTSISRLQLTGGKLVNDAEFAVAAGTVIRFGFAQKYRIVEGWACADMRAGRLSVTQAGTRKETRRAKEFVRRDLAAMGKICAGYFQIAPRQYQVRFRTYSGKAMPGKDTVVQFFEQKPALRP